MKNTRRSSACRLALRLLGETTDILRRDLQDDVEELLKVLKDAAVAEPRIKDFDYQLKSAIRSFFGLAEAVNNTIAPAIIQSSGSGGLLLASRDRALLLERDYDSAHDVCLGGPRHYPLALRLQVSFRLFPIACGARPLPDWAPTTVAYFKELTRFRNRLTHPTRLIDLFPLPAFDSFRQVAPWFTLELRSVLTRAAHGLGIPIPNENPPSATTVLPLSESLPRPEDIFNADFEHEIHSNPTAAIRYLRFFSAHLDDEIERALSICNSALEPPYRSRVVSRSIRNLVRAVTAAVEGTIGYTLFFMRAVRPSKGKVSVPQRLRGEPVPERLISALSALSKAFGEGNQPMRDGNWQAFNSVFEARDRLTHPRSAADLEFDLSHFDIVHQAIDWYFSNGQPLYYLDEHKFADCIGSRRQSHSRALPEGMS